MQLGLRGDMLASYGRREIIEILDMTPLAVEQRERTATWRDGSLYTPTERVYRPNSKLAAARLGLDALP